jgi:sortase (surface protein transpeptidase)
MWSRLRQQRASSWQLLWVAAYLLLSTPAAAQEEVPLTPALPPQVAPVWIDIPRIGTHASIVALGEDENGALAAPVDPDTVGWYELGPGIGWSGNILLDGHVDWGGRLRVFGLLKQLQEGDEITLQDANGGAQSYSVLWTKFYADADTAPLDEIYDTTPTEQLTLITCGGAFDQTMHMYLGRWVVRATPISAD